MRIPFTKMQGAGNDFVVLDETRGSFGLSTAQYRFLADRHFGVGADQILSVRPSPGTCADVTTAKRGTSARGTSTAGGSMCTPPSKSTRGGVRGQPTAPTARSTPARSPLTACAPASAPAVAARGRAS